MKVAAHSARPRLGAVRANVDAVAAAVRGTAADLHLFPEMFLTGYAIGDDAQRLAFAPEDSRLRPLERACEETGSWLVVGGPRTERRGLYHNSAFLFGPGGRQEAYDKRCLANYTTFREGMFFQRGTTSPVWETPLGRIGIGICYDLFFPEFARRQSFEGADLLVNVSASPLTSQRFFEALLVARAVENASFVAYSNCVGPQDAIVFWGGSQVIGPRGQRMAQVAPMQEGVAVAEIDLDDVAAARQFRPTLRDGFLAEVEAAEAARQASEDGSGKAGASQAAAAAAGVTGRRRA